MSEDYSQIGTVRRRPRSTHSRNGSRPQENSAGANGEDGSYGPHKRNGSGGNGRSDAESEEWAGRRSGEPKRKRVPRSKQEPRPALPYYGPDLDEEPGFRLPFDPVRLLRAAKRNSPWIVLSGLLVAILGFFAGLTVVDYKISMQLLRKTSNAMRNDGVQMIDKFAVREYSDQTIYAFMKSGEVMKNVAAKAAENPVLAPLRVTPGKLASAVGVKPSDNPDFVILSMKAFGGLSQMVGLLNLYAQEVVAYTKEVQRGEASIISQYLQRQVEEADKNIQKITEEMRGFSQTGIGDYERENDLELKQLISLRDKLAQRKLDLDTLNTKIQVREQQLKNQAPGGSSAAAAAKAELQQMLITMREENPLVIAKRKEIAMLEQRKDAPVAVTPNGPGMASNPLFMLKLDLEAQKPGLETDIQETERLIAQLEKKLRGEGGTSMEYALKKTELQSQRASRDALQARQRDSQLYTDNALGYFQVQSPATLDNVNYKGRWIKVSALAIFAGLLGVLAVMFLVMLSEALDTSLKTEEDIARVTGLPVLAKLGDLRKMSAAAQVNWAFRTLTVLKGKLSKNADEAMVCGIISANHGEGRSTWVNLLTSAASQRGLRVLTVDTRPTAAAPATSDSRKETRKPEPKPEPVSAAKAADGEKEANGHGPIHLPEQMDGEEDPSLPSAGALVQKFDDPDSQSMVHIPLPGWVWNLERRKQWQDALEQWREMENLVIFVELPPASEPESILLAENLPQLIWLVGSGMADAAETKTHLETIQHARCNLVGTVLNHAPPPVFNTRLARWFHRVTSAIVLLGTLAFAQAQQVAQPETAPAAPGAELRPAVTNPREKKPEQQYAFSASARRKRAAWQERLTFGPGDSMDIHVYGRPAMSRTNIVVGPDGRISFLHANNVTASGLTVDELRQKLDNELARYYTEAAAPRTIVVPIAFTSKKYFMLGKVNSKGAYVLDRPLTLLEAVARAKGLETGLYQRTSVEMADLGRSFLVRNGEKLPVDFEKLFQEGDLAQNVVLEPNDYIYFASTAANDIYILGEVMSPGPIGFVPNATVLSAIVDRGGFSERAFKKRVLVVRGSLSEPETFVVDVGGTLDARLRDFRLQPRDIVYVSARPWIRAEELLDEAASSFIQGAVTTWAGVNVGPIIKSRLLPRTRPQ